jgi:hypothetical protein
VAYSTTNPVLNGGDEETGLCRPCLVATQLECGDFNGEETAEIFTQTPENYSRSTVDCFMNVRMARSSIFDRIRPGSDL